MDQDSTGACLTCRTAQDIPVNANEYEKPVRKKSAAATPRHVSSEVDTTKNKLPACLAMSRPNVVVTVANLTP